MEVTLAYEVVQAILYFLDTLLLIFGNALVIITFKENRNLLKPMNSYVLSISVSGLLIGFLMPTNVGYFANPFYPPTLKLSQNFYRVHMILFFTAILSSVLCMVAIAAERYRTLVLMSVNPPRHNVIIICAWVFSFLYQLPLFEMELQSGVFYLVDRNNVSYQYYFPTGVIVQGHFTASVLLVYVMPLTVMTFFYSRIIRKVRSNLKRLVDGPVMYYGRLKAVKAMIVIVVIFGVCWSLGHVLQLLIAWWLTEDEQGCPQVTFGFLVFHDLVIHVLVAHNWMHVFIYAKCSRQCHMAIMQVVRKVVRHLLCCRVVNRIRDSETRNEIKQKRKIVFCNITDGTQI